MIFKFTLALTKLGKNKSIVQQQNVFGHAAVFYSNALLFLVSSKTDLEQETNAPSFSRAGFSHVQLLATKDHIQYSQNQEPTSEQSIFGAFCECSRLSYLIKMCPSLSQNAFTTYRQIIRQDISGGEENFEAPDKDLRIHLWNSEKLCYISLYTLAQTEKKKHFEKF